MDSNWSYSPETVKLSCDLCDHDLWPLTLTFCMDVTFVTGNNSWKFHDDRMMGTESKRCDRQTDGQTDRQTDGRTDWTIHRAAWSQLKTQQFICNSFHLSKVDGPFIGLVGTAESRTFLGGQHTSKEFSHKKTSFCDYWDFFICCLQHFGLYAQKVLSYP